MAGARSCTEAIVPPAIVTPQTNVHIEFSGDLGARLYRVTHEPSTGDRSGRPRLIALTFDDGPYPVFTPMLLDVLARPARSGDVLSDRSRRAAVAGAHAAHRGRRQRDRRSYLHASRISIKRRADEVRREILTGTATRCGRSRTIRPCETLMRPPHGRYTESTLQIAQASDIRSCFGPTTAATGERVTVPQLQRHLS